MDIYKTSLIPNNKNLQNDINNDHKDSNINKSDIIFKNNNKENILPKDEKNLIKNEIKDNKIDNKNVNKNSSSSEEYEDAEDTFIKESKGYISSNKININNEQDKNEDITLKKIEENNEMSGNNLDEKKNEINQVPKFKPNVDIIEDESESEEETETIKNIQKKQALKNNNENNNNNKNDQEKNIEEDKI